MDGDPVDLIPIAAELSIRRYDETDDPRLHVAVAGLRGDLRGKVFARAPAGVHAHRHRGEKHALVLEADGLIGLPQQFEDRLIKQV